MMKNNYKNLIIGTTAIFFLFFVFNFSFAANTFTYPWSGQTTIPGLINRIYIWGLGVAGGSAFVVLIWGAILYTISGAVDKKTEAKEWIKGAIYGLILLLGAYLILYTINPNLVNLKFGLPALNVPTSDTFSPLSSSTINRPYMIAGDQELLTKTYTNQEAIDALNQQGIGVVSTLNCFGKNEQGCTDMSNMSYFAMNKTIQLKNAAGLSDGELVITGANEKTGHSAGTTHGDGLTEDFSSKVGNSDAKISNFVTSNAINVSSYTDPESKNTYPVYTMPDGSKFMRESSPSHWHVHWADNPGLIK